MNNLMLYIQKLLHQQNMALEGRLLDQNQDALSKNLPILDLSAEFLTQLEKTRLQLNGQIQEIDYRQRDIEIKLTQKINDFFLQKKDNKMADSFTNTFIVDPNNQSNQKGAPPRKVKLRRPQVDQLRDSVDKGDYEEYVTGEDAMNYIDALIRTQVFEKSTLINNVRASLEEQYSVLEWLLLYNKYMDHDQYKYLMKKIT